MMKIDLVRMSPFEYCQGKEANGQNFLRIIS
jgi:hypothetical protein